MKRLHVHVSVDDLDRTVGFYSALFATEPTVRKPDYAKWALDDPSVNFAVSQRGREPGIEHLGIEVETQDELAEVYARIGVAGQPVLEEGATTCCYHRSEKSWVADPQGVVWEAFRTDGETGEYGKSRAFAETKDDACCTPETPQGVCCAPKVDLAEDAPCCG